MVLIPSKRVDQKEKFASLWGRVCVIDSELLLHEISKKGDDPKISR